MLLALAFLLGFVLDPMVGRLKKIGLSRTPAVIVVVVATVALVVAIGLLLGTQVTSPKRPLYTTWGSVSLARAFA